MTGRSTMTPANTQPLDELDLKDLTDRASDTVEGLMSFVDEAALPAPARLLWKTGMALYDKYARVEHKYTAERRLGYLLMLDALLASPRAVDHALCQLRNELKDGDPDLILIGDTALEVGVDV